METVIPREEVWGQVGAVQVWYRVPSNCHPTFLGKIVMLQVPVHRGAVNNPGCVGLRLHRAK